MEEDIQDLEPQVNNEQSMEEDESGDEDNENDQENPSQDDNEEDEEGAKGMDNFDPSKMNQFEAQSESKSGYQAGDLLEQRNVVSCDYFTVQENAKTVVDLI